VNLVDDQPSATIAEVSDITVALTPITTDGSSQGRKKSPEFRPTDSDEIVQPSKIIKVSDATFTSVSEKRDHTSDTFKNDESWLVDLVGEEAQMPGGLITHDAFVFVLYNYRHRVGQAI